VVLFPDHGLCPVACDVSDGLPLLHSPTDAATPQWLKCLFPKVCLRTQRLCSGNNRYILVDRLMLVTGCRLLELEKLSLDCPHAGHEAVEFAQEKLFVLTGLLDRVCGRTVADPVESICKSRIQKPHMPLQINEFLMQLTLLEHNPISSGAAV
jgi:hypothetical protein